MTWSTARRHVAALAVVTTVATAALTLPPAVDRGPVAHAAPTPALALEAAQRSVTLTRHRMGDGDGQPHTWVEGDLGVHVVARSRAFEVRAQRADYSTPVVLRLSVPGDDPVLTTSSAITGLPGFWATTVADAAGKVVLRSTSDFCPNALSPVRRRPDAPSASPYPQGCQANPYSLGGVFGIQAGYAVPAALDPEELSHLPLGTYTVTVTIGSGYAKALALTAAQARVQVKVTMVQGASEDEPEPPAARTARPALRTAATGPLGRRIRPAGPLPDLRSLPAWGIDVADGRHLVFAATVWNAGPGRLVVDGFRTTYDPDLMRAYQYFFSANGQQQGYAPAGTMEWDARDGHDHWHFTDFASYRLLDADKRLVVRSGKEAFCLANTDVVDYLVPGANWRPSGTDLHSACGDRGSLGVREVLDTGSGDTYAQYLPGQSFDLRGLANGTYWIEVRANPDRALYETRTNNNTSYRKVVVGGPAGSRTVTAEKVGIVDEAAVVDEGGGHVL